MQTYFSTTATVAATLLVAFGVLVHSRPARHTLSLMVMDGVVLYSGFFAVVASMLGLFNLTLAEPQPVTQQSMLNMSVIGLVGALCGLLASYQLPPPHRKDGDRQSDGEA